jgi:hypothetical protein
MASNWAVSQNSFDVAEMILMHTQKEFSVIIA